MSRSTHSQTWYGNPRPWRRAVKTAALLSRHVSRLLRAGEGTSLPGLIVERLDPRFVERAAASVKDGAILVSGTNGKTTTAAMIRHILRDQGIEVVGNDDGANLSRGIATAFLDARLSTDLAVLEVDEAVVPDAVRSIRPRMLVLTNVFRDQLDRFGEVEHVAALLGTAAELLPQNSVLLLNGDDPLLSYACKSRPGITFGVEGFVTEETGADAEPQICPRCDSDFDYETRTVAHLGRGLCPRCGWRTGRPDRAARILESRGLDGMSLEISGRRVALQIGGVHGAYNSVAAVAAAELLGISTRAACASLRTFVPKFGRNQVVHVEGRQVHLLLMKNPAGAGAVIRQARSHPQLGCFVVVVNDLTADGTDISWIWDADLESLAATQIPIIPSGRRHLDVAVRMKYAGRGAESPIPDPITAVRAAALRCPEGKDVVVLATYTAMLKLTRQLARLGSKETIS